MSEKPDELALAKRSRLAARRITMIEQLKDEVDALRKENERLREENRLWYSRAVALFWKCDTDNITVGRLQSAAKEIDAALRREDV